MSDDTGFDAVVGFWIGVVLAVVAVCGLHAFMPDRDLFWQKEIIRHGAGQHNPVTGEFEWLVPAHDTAVPIKEFF